MVMEILARAYVHESAAGELSVIYETDIGEYSIRYDLDNAYGHERTLIDALTREDMQSLAAAVAHILSVGE